MFFRWLFITRLHSSILIYTRLHSSILIYTRLYSSKFYRRSNLKKPAGGGYGRDWRPSRRRAPGPLPVATTRLGVPLCTRLEVCGNSLIVFLEIYWNIKRTFLNIELSWNFRRSVMAKTQIPITSATSAAAKKGKAVLAPRISSTAEVLRGGKCKLEENGRHRKIPGARSMRTADSAADAYLSFTRLKKLSAADTLFTRSEILGGKDAEKQGNGICSISQGNTRTTIQKYIN